MMENEASLTLADLKIKTSMENVETPLEIIYLNKSQTTYYENRFFSFYLPFFKEKHVVSPLRFHPRVNHCSLLRTILSTGYINQTSHLVSRQRRLLHQSSR